MVNGRPSCGCNRGFPLRSSQNTALWEGLSFSSFLSGNMGKGMT